MRGPGSEGVHLLARGTLPISSHLSRNARNSRRAASRSVFGVISFSASASRASFSDALAANSLSRSEATEFRAAKNTS